MFLERGPASPYPEGWDPFTLSEVDQGGIVAQAANDSGSQRS